MGFWNNWTTDNVNYRQMKIDLLHKGALAAILGLIVSLACNSIALRTAPVPTSLPDDSAPETAVLTEVLQKMEGCPSSLGIKAENHTFSFSCSHSADTHYTISMTRFDSETEARAQFDLRRGGNPIQCFHGYDLYKTTSQNPNNQYIVQEELGWQAGPWFFLISASYDYGYFHFTALNFSEALYTSSQGHELFPARVCPPQE